jgi:dUTP pyrophosphatase
MKLKIKKLVPSAAIPAYATAGAACFDLVAVEVPAGGVTVQPKAPAVFRTGLAFEIPPGWVMLINSRSGHGFKHDIRLANSAGVIDSDYRGEVQVKLTCDLMADGEPFVVNSGDRIAQAMLVQCPQVTFEEVDALSDTARGAGGFGSTGKA